MKKLDLELNKIAYAFNLETGLRSEGDHIDDCLYIFIEHKESKTQLGYIQFDVENGMVYRGADNEEFVDSEVDMDAEDKEELREFLLKEAEEFADNKIRNGAYNHIIVQKITKALKKQAKELSCRNFYEAEIEIFYKNDLVEKITEEYLEDKEALDFITDYELRDLQHDICNEYERLECNVDDYSFYTDIACDDSYVYVSVTHESTDTDCGGYVYNIKNDKLQSLEWCDNAFVGSDLQRLDNEELEDLASFLWKQTLPHAQKYLDEFISARDDEDLKSSVSY